MLEKWISVQKSLETVKSKGWNLKMNSEYYTKKFINSLEKIENVNPDITQIHPTVFDNTIDSEMPDLEGRSDSENDDFTFLKL